MANSVTALGYQHQPLMYVETITVQLRKIAQPVLGIVEIVFQPRLLTCAEMLCVIIQKHVPRAHGIVESVSLLPPLMFVVTLPVHPLKIAQPALLIVEYAQP